MNRLKGINEFKIIDPKPIINQLPRLQFGLESLILKSGPAFLINRETGKFDYDPYLLNIPQMETLRLDNLKPFVRAAQDTKLHQIGRDNNALCNSSTSSITGFLSQIYHLLMNQSRLDTSSFSPDLSGALSAESSPFLRSGSEVQLVFNDGVYTIDAISVSNKTTDLMTYGHILELFFTTTPEEFARIFNAPKALDPPELYSYGKYDNIIVRSQLDVQNPSTTMAFDLKSRAVLPIRKSIDTYKKHLWYEITELNGLYQSFEREYYDMLRSAFLKYSLQARLGNMEGIFVAYHNTSKVFGFESISLQEMERGLFGSNEFAELMFSFSMSMLNTILMRVVEIFPNQDSKLFIAKPGNHNMMIFVEPLNPKTWQKPVHFHVSTSAIVNGDPVKRLLIKPGDSWHVEFDLNELDYDPTSHQAKLKQYMRMHNSTHAGGMFNQNLKQLLDKGSKNGLLKF